MGTGKGQGRAEVIAEISLHFRHVSTHYYAHFTDEGMEIQRNAICSKSHAINILDWIFNVGYLWLEALFKPIQP